MTADHEAPSGEAGFTLVELLVVIVLLAIVGAATISAVVSTLRTQTYTQELRTVVDESRIVYERARKEIRSARRVLDSATADELKFWVDANADGLQQLTELVTYKVCPVPSVADRYRIVRFTEADGTPPSCTDGRIFAETLRNNTPFAYVKNNVTHPNSAATAVTFDFVYDVDTATGPTSFQTTSTVRLRNVA